MNIPPEALDSLLEVLFAGLGEATLKAKKSDLRAFAAWAGEKDMLGVARRMFEGGQGGANELALRYRQGLIEEGKTPATINRRLSSIRSLVKMGRMLGHVPWTLEVTNLKVQALRDTRGPGKSGVELLLTELERMGGALGARGAATVHLLFDLGLRRKEVAGLDLADLNISPDRTTLAILGKGRRQKELVTLPSPTEDAIELWLSYRGNRPGALFHRLDSAGSGGRLTGQSIYKQICKVGRSVGLRVSPHGLRHAAVTEALKRTGGNVRAAQKFARHADPRTTMVYDDNLEDVAGQTAELVAERSEKEDE